MTRLEAFDADSSHPGMAAENQNYSKRAYNQAGLDILREPACSRSRSTTLES
jgi:hypothetical protein